MAQLNPPSSCASATAGSDCVADLFPDLIAVPNYNANWVMVAKGDGTGSYSSWALYETGRAPTTPAVKDVNKDGKPDLVFSSYLGTVGVLLGKGLVPDPSGDPAKATLGFESATQWVTGIHVSAVDVADLNGDGTLDAVTSNRDPDLVTVVLGTLK
jgi:hypothetical protein